MSKDVLTGLPPLKFKIGDRVRVIESNGEPGEPPLNAAGVIKLIYSHSKLPYRFMDDSGPLQWASESQLELVKPAALPDLDACGQPVPDWAKEVFDILSESTAAVSIDGWFYHDVNSRAHAGDFAIFPDKILLCSNDGRSHSFTPLDADSARVALKERSVVVSASNITRSRVGKELADPYRDGSDRQVYNWAIPLFEALLAAGFDSDNIGVEIWPKGCQEGDVRITGATMLEVYVDKGREPIKLLQGLTEPLINFGQRVGFVGRLNEDGNGNPVPPWAMPIYKLLVHDDQMHCVTVGARAAPHDVGALAIFEQPMGEFDVQVWRPDDPLTFRYRPTASLETFARHVLDCQEEIVARRGRKAAELEREARNTAARLKREAGKALFWNAVLAQTTTKTNYVTSPVPTESAPMSDIPKIPVPTTPPGFADIGKILGDAAVNGLARSSVEVIGDRTLEFVRDASEHHPFVEMVLSTERGREFTKGLVAAGLVVLPVFFPQAMKRVPKPHLIQRIAAIQFDSSVGRVGKPLIAKGMKFLEALVKIGEELPEALVKIGEELPELEEASAGGAITDGRSGDAKVVDFSKAQADKVAAQ